MNKNETINLESIDIILQNLKKDSQYYNHGMTEEPRRINDFE